MLKLVTPLPNALTLPRCVQRNEESRDRCLNLNLLYTCPLIWFHLVEKGRVTLGATAPAKLTNFSKLAEMLCIFARCGRWSRLLKSRIPLMNLHQSDEMNEQLLQTVSDRSRNRVPHAEFHRLQRNLMVCIPGSQNSAHNQLF